MLPTTKGYRSQKLPLILEPRLPRRKARNGEFSFESFHAPKNYGVGNLRRKKRREAGQVFPPPCYSPFREFRLA